MSDNSIRELAEAIVAYSRTKHRMPTHLYGTGDALVRFRIAARIGGWTVLGLRMVPCEPMPDAREWFVTA